MILRDQSSTHTTRSNGKKMSYGPTDYVCVHKMLLLLDFYLRKWGPKTSEGLRGAMTEPRRTKDGPRQAKMS